MALSIFVRPKIIWRYRSKKFNATFNSSNFIVQVVKILLGPVLIYDILSAIVYTIITCVFYKIFKSSIFSNKRI